MVTCESALLVSRERVGGGGLRGVGRESGEGGGSVGRGEGVGTLKGLRGWVDRVSGEGE